MMMLILLMSLLMVVLPLGQSFVFPPSHHHHHDVNTMNNGQQLRTTTLFVANSEISDIHGSIDEEDLDISGPSTMHIASINNNNNNDNIIDYSSMTTLPRHPTNDDANEILTQTEEALRGMQDRILLVNADTDDDDDDAIISSSSDNNNNNDQGYYEPILLDDQSEMIPTDIEKESVYANSYVDLGKVNTVGFDYDYTLVTYTESLLELIYDMALKRLVEEKEYPREMMECGLKFDPFFSIRGEIVLLVVFKCLCMSRYICI